MEKKNEICLTYSNQHSDDSGELILELTKQSEINTYGGVEA
jgi:hypothetical protein